MNIGDPYLPADKSDATANGTSPASPEGWDLHGLDEAHPDSQWLHDVISQMELGGLPGAAPAGVDVIEKILLEQVVEDMPSEIDGESGWTQQDILETNAIALIFSPSTDPADASTYLEHFRTRVLDPQGTVAASETSEFYTPVGGAAVTLTACLGSMLVAGTLAVVLRHLAIGLFAGAVGGSLLWGGLLGAAVVGIGVVGVSLFYDNATAPPESDGSLFQLTKTALASVLSLVSAGGAAGLAAHTQVQEQRLITQIREQIVAAKGTPDEERLQRLKFEKMLFGTVVRDAHGYRHYVDLDEAKLPTAKILQGLSKFVPWIGAGNCIATAIHRLS